MPVASQRLKCYNITNLLKNHSAEKSGDWGKGWWKSSSVSYTGEMTTADSLFGSRSLKLTGTDMPSEGAAVYYQDVDSENAEPGKTYTFSSYVKTSSVARDTEKHVTGRAWSLSGSPVHNSCRR